MTPSDQQKPRRVWVVSELYYPEQSATGYYLTRIAEGLAPVFDVHAISGQPTYAARGVRAPNRERWNGVSILRCRTTTFSKDRLPGRMANLMTFTLTAFFKALAVLRRGDRVLVVTNPPTVPFVIAAASYLRGASCFLLIHDVYPDAMVAAGMIREGSPLTRLLHAFQCWLYRSVTHVIVLGRDMRALIEKRSANRSDAISIVPNWADTEQLAPAGRAGNPLLRRLGLDSALVVQYSGNMGRTHGIECIVRAAAALPPASRAHLLFIGSGAKRSWLEREVAARQLGNCTVLSPLRRDELATSLNACDVAIIAFVPGMAGVSVPSRMYNIMAVGKPIIAVAEEESELALVVREEQIGWVVRPDDVDGLREAIVQAERDPDGRAAMGERARRAAEEKYAYDVVIQKYTRLFNESQG